MNIFVAKLSASTTNEDLQELFEEYGDVSSAKVIFDRETGYSKRFGFVEMSNEDEALKAIDELNECEFDNSEIVVKKARPKTENSNNNRGGGGGRRKEYNNRY